jgi:hypothetical protein
VCVCVRVCVRVCVCEKEYVGMLCTSWHVWIRYGVLVCVCVNKMDLQYVT